MKMNMNGEMGIWMNGYESSEWVYRSMGMGI